MFSIADIQAEDMEELEEEDSESDVDDSPAPYPCRVSLSITKVLITLFSTKILTLDIRGITTGSRRRST